MFVNKYVLTLHAWMKYIMKSQAIMKWQQYYHCKKCKTRLCRVRWDSCQHKFQYCCKLPDWFSGTQVQQIDRINNSLILFWVFLNYFFPCCRECISLIVRKTKLNKGWLLVENEIWDFKEIYWSYFFRYQI